MELDDKSESNLIHFNATNGNRSYIYFNTSYPLAEVEYTYSYILSLHVLHYMKLYFTPSLVTVGVLGNTASLFTLLRAKLKNFSSSHYLLALCVVNNMYLVLTLLKWLVVHGITVSSRPGLCQVMSFMENSSVFLSNWYVVAFCVDRYITFCWPTEGMRLCSKVRARIVITTLCVVAVVVYINISITEGVVIINGQFRCRHLPFSLHNLKVLVVIKGVLNVVVPYILIILLSVLTTVNLYFMHTRDTFSDDDSPSLLKRTTVVYLVLFYMLHTPFELYHLFNIFRGILYPFYMIPNWEFVTQAFLMHLFNMSMSMHWPVYMCTYPLFRNYLKQSCVTDWNKCFLSRHNKSVKETVEFTGINQNESAV